MKRWICLFLALSLALGLCACGGGAKPASPEPEQTGAVDPSTGAWTGLGGCYRTEPLDIPEEASYLSAYQGELYSLVFYSPEDCRVCRGDRELCQTGGVFYSLCACEEGVWLLGEEREEGTFFVLLQLYSAAGELLKTLRIQLPPNCYPRDLEAAEGRLYLNCSSVLLVYDGEGAQLAAIPHEEWAGELLRGGDGAVYFLDQKGSGGGFLSGVNLESASLEERFRFEKGYVSGGDGESPLLLLLPEGLYRLELDGSSRPLALWDECMLSVSGVTAAQAMGDGSFLLNGMTVRPLRLRPAEPSEIKPKTRLTICVIPSQQELDRDKDVTLSYGRLIQAVTGYNARSADTIVKIVEATEGGSLTAEQALTRLNTQLISGDEAPDMVLISGAVSPFPLIRHGLLRDLSLDLAEDPDMSLEDIVIGDAVIRDCGGLFLLSDSFSFMPRVALQSRFGQVWGWSFDQYLELARQTPEDRMVMYNLTRDYFLDSSLSRCLRQGIDWKAGTCDFDNPDFVAVLEACRDMKETPEDPNNMVFGGNLMAEGFMLTELTMLTDVTDLAKEQRRIGQPICVIGWPTLDGSCGEDFEIGRPIGVLNGTAHPERCWDFLKYCLNNPDSGIPVYRPLMERKLDDARHIDPNASYDYWYDGLRSPMTEEEIAFFRDFLAQVRHTDLRDETAMSIAKEEAQAFLAGQISAGEAASRVQKRMSIYVSEQG